MLDGHNSSDFVFLSQLKDKIKLIDGSGSGIDADTLDGVQGSSYARSNGSTSKTFNVASATSDNHAVRRSQIKNIPHSIGLTHPQADL